MLCGGPRLYMAWRFLLPMEQHQNTISLMVSGFIQTSSDWNIFMRKDVEETHNSCVPTAGHRWPLCPRNIRNRKNLLLLSASSLYPLQTSLINIFFKAIVSIRLGDAVLLMIQSQNRDERTQFQWNVVKQHSILQRVSHPTVPSLLARPTGRLGIICKSLHSYGR